MRTTKRTSPPTLKEVASASGVSLSSVWKVLHGKGDSIRVSETTAAHIREVAKRLQYRPNALARSLRTSRTDVVGLVYESFGDIATGPLYQVLLLDGISAELFENHFRLMILPDVSYDRVNQTLMDGRVDGVIWCKIPEEPRLHKALAEWSFPIVVINAPAYPDSPLPCFVTCDNEGGIDLAVEHLYGLGHQRILFGLEEPEKNTPDSQERLAGMWKAMQTRGLPFSEEDVLTFDAKGDNFAPWWQSKPPHTAIIAWDEGMAGKILRQAHDLGVRVPGELSVVGFDSTIYCEGTTPKLTAVCQPIKDMAREAARLLMRLICGENLPERSVRYPCTFDVRESTAPPRD